MNWWLIIVAAIVGGVVGAAVMALFCMSGSVDQTQEMILLRVALGNLVRAVEKGGADAYERAVRVSPHLEEARKVLAR